MECYEFVLNIKPDHASAATHKKSLLERLDSYDKGMSLLKMGLLTDAITCFNQVLDVNSKHLSALYNKGVALESLSKFEESLKCYQSIIQQDPQYEDAALQAGKILSSLERHEEAIKIYDIGLKSNPNDVSTLYYKSKSMIKQGKENDIPKLVEHILSLDSRYIEILKNEVDFIKYIKPITNT